ncbi:hypothetical protein [Thalassobacter sp. 16PALIMAR09]|uniref:hypothetical protein n=1 Tax=Thalassobacter sp. 16PALIMAR09 TaxID=1225651 RepID=UPI00051CC54D|nr:hypothetical protein [Thalassobacter sp. 16PALIMAR09]KGK99919.1 hypothetical protein PM04_17060 [Thalassobacter sp. 16PALIMAR09]
MIETGLHVIYNTTARLHYAVDVQETYAGLAVFEPCEPGQGGRDAMGILPWADLKAVLEVPESAANKAGFVDLAGNGTFVPDLPGCPHGAVYKGRSYIFLDGMVGHDELTDYALIDIMTDNAGFPLPWRNRFAQSAREKVDYSFRHRARTQASNALVIFMPIAGPLSGARVELLCDQDPILLNGTSVAGRIDDATIPNDGVWFKQFYFHAGALGGAALTVPAGGRTEVPIALRWNGDGAPCAHALTLKLDSDAGYLAKRRLNTDENGLGSFAIEALGLRPGDRIAVKVNTEHYTAIGKILLEVV